jgi:tripartite-type tricarboxylate transporter receptor subunit TctC
MLRRALFAISILLGIGGAAATAQTYPDKPVRIVVPFAPGGGADLSGRLAAEELSKRLGQGVIVENKPGAGTQIGIDLVAKARPDGYTLGWTTSDGLSLLPAVKPSVTYKVPDDITFVAGTASFSLVIAVNPKLPITSMAELLAYGKANPGKLRYASSGAGGGGHLAGALIGKELGIDMVHVPFQGGAPAVTAVVGGHVDMTVVAAAAIKPFADAGTLRVIATTGTERHTLFPDVPTMRQVGYPGLTIVFHMGMIGPAGMPPPALERVRKEVAAMLADPAFAARLTATGSVAGYLPGDDYRNALVSDLARWRDVAKTFNIVVAE